MNESCPDDLPCVTGRDMFLTSLRIRWPALWQGLNYYVWRGPDKDLSGWAARQGRGITDEWLIRAFRQTLEYWSDFPDSPNAQLEEDARWFFFWDQTETPNFEPRFSAPYPTYRYPGGTAAILHDVQEARTYEAQRALVERCELESLEAFDKRIRKQFDQQLRLYIRKIRDAYIYDSSPELANHSNWTALYLGGMSFADIARAPEWERRFQRGEPDSTVRKAVVRFADRIGLTLHH
jgi:hypothetical protein